MKSLKLESFRQIQGLPSLPGQILKILTEIGATSSMDYHIVQAIQYDMAIALRVLKRANTPLYGYPSKVLSLQQAAGLLGPAAIKNMVLTTSILERFQEYDPSVNDTDYSKLWRHMAVTAAIAGGLANLQEIPEADICFTAGLVHHAGRVAMLVYHPGIMTRVIQRARMKKISLIQSEQEILGFSHTDISSELFSAWNFPDRMVRMVRSCSITEDEDFDDGLTALVSLAKWLAWEWGFGCGLETGKPARAEKILRYLNISKTDIETWGPQLQEYISYAVRTLEE